MLDFVGFRAKFPINLVDLPLNDLAIAIVTFKVEEDYLHQSHPVLLNQS